VNSLTRKPEIKTVTQTGSLKMSTKRGAAAAIPFAATGAAP